MCGSTVSQAGHNFAKDIPLAYIKGLLGAKRSINNGLPIKSHNGMSDSEIPEEFDSEPLAQMSHHQAYSSADLAGLQKCQAVAASAFSDRACIASNGTFKKQLSAEELSACCEECGEGCNGGFSTIAWYFFMKNGVVTGGDFHSHVGCQPYQIEPCEHHTTGKRPQCSTLSVPTPKCKRACINPIFKGDFKQDHHQVKSVFTVRSAIADIQKEVMRNGPVEVAFTVYEDFPNYKEGVYHHVTGQELGGHAVRLIGWGTENGTPYWLIANSWNSDWGDKGVFKILRWKNECGIEDEVVAGDL